MIPNECQFSPVSGRPYEIPGAGPQWLLNIRSPNGLAAILEEVLQHVAPRPCAAMLRVYGELTGDKHVFRLSSAPAAIDLLDRCEAVGVFDSADLVRDQHSIMAQLDDLSDPYDDEACVLRAVRPRPVIFLHAGHDDIDLVCGISDAQRILSIARQKT